MESVFSSSHAADQTGHLVSHRSLQSESSDSSPFVEYKPPARDAISVPPHVLYVTVGLLLVVVAMYAIVGHLINDLLHDLAGTVSPDLVTRLWWNFVLPVTPVL
ncbi:small integral membrane protein 44-like [Xyrauchen texanus]|uniref:small integral membrane protein 44-like n=1 Tax=Xyrauchen texanus TaxID=154827 RepID=UPI0022428FF6|nr:small integral membrane protein 44-like [Xyrauchen texanus]